MNQSGFTLIEVIVVLSIVVLLAALSSGFAGIAVQQNTLLNTSSDVVDTLRRAQSHTMNGQQDGVWGVYFTSDSFVLFLGPTYIAEADDNIPTVLSSSMTISNISLNGGGTDVLFDDPYGDTDEYGSLLISDVTTSKTKTISINEMGMVDMN